MTGLLWGPEAFSSQVGTLGSLENATKQSFSVLPVSKCERETH